MIYMDKFIEAGKIINTHGVAGDVKIEVWLDSPEFFRKFKRVFLDNKEYKVLRASIQKSFILAHLEGIDTLDSAVLLKNKTVYINREDVLLPKGKFYLSDIIGAEVFDTDGEKIGVLIDIIENPAHMIYVVKGEVEHLIPAVPEFIISTDVDNKILTVNLIEGL